MEEGEWVLVRRAIERNLWNPSIGDGGESSKPLKVMFSWLANCWTDAIPIANGGLGAMVWGGVASETLQLNVVDDFQTMFRWPSSIMSSKMTRISETAACFHTKESFGRVMEAFCTEVVLSNDKNQEKGAFSYMKRSLGKITDDLFGEVVSFSDEF
ncbi:hypothetical protein Pint_28906 [Pistacia integerrima]|uniref:Uncharacterized protein n=1 Tax=Pistacia integerrima TaxID=434235 RepID=A0ACC0X0U4_9ROSI|nr:hypothetical protein Pint_28906 [Pistacia integerrima]